MEQYRQKADIVLNHVPRHNLPSLERSLKKALKRSQDWIAKVHANELRWIESGENPEVEFERHYYRRK